MLSVRDYEQKAKVQVCILRDLRRLRKGPRAETGFHQQCCVLLSTASVTHPTFASHVNFQPEDTGAEKSPEHEAGKRGCKVKAKAGSL